MTSLTGGGDRLVRGCVPRIEKPPSPLLLSQTAITKGHVSRQKLMFKPRVNSTVMIHIPKRNFIKVIWKKHTFV